MDDHIELERAEGTAANSADEKLSVLRELRAEVQDIQSLLVNVREGRAVLSVYAPYIQSNKREIARLFRRIAQGMPDEAVLPSDSIGHLSNLWQQLLCSSILATPDSKLEPEVLIKQLTICDELCTEIVVHVGNLTIPARLNFMLGNAWAGTLLSFHDLFGNEMPRLEDRQRLLRHLASVPGLIRAGIVEPTNGVIFPYHRSAWQRILTCAALLLGLVGITVGIALLDEVPGITATTGLKRGDLVLNWLLVVAGVLVHLGIERSKSNVGGAVSVPTSHLSTAIDARSGTILIKMMLMVFGYFGLLFLGGPHNNGHLNAFLVGYSLDSFVGIFSATLDKKALARGATLSRLAEG